MVLDLGGTGLLDTEAVRAPSGYRTAERGQLEVVKYLKHGANQNYETIHTVTTGKTFFMTEYVLAADTGTANLLLFATGAAASEVDFLAIKIAANENQHITFQVQARFASATRISVKTGTSVTSEHITIIGFEE